MVEGYYWIKDQINPHLSRGVRQSREYKAEGEKQAIELAKKDGLETERSFNITSGFSHFGTISGMEEMIIRRETRINRPFTRR